ncbi:MAG: hypothetical protein JXB62_17135 [Pirellulales bacterium]|nr:hypothetical protein [Pirellulales bacterium]
MNRRTLLVAPLLLWGLARAEAQQPPAVPGQDWWTSAPVFRSNYYALKTDLPAEDAQALADHLDATFESYLRLVSMLPVRLRRPARLEVYLLAQEQDYQNVLRLRFQDDGAGSWGKCITRGNTVSLVGWRGHHTNEQMKPLLQHESFHQVAGHFFPGLPVWADEGLAETFERGVMVGDQLALGEFAEHDKRRLLAAVEGKTIVPFELFFAIGADQWGQRVRGGAAGTLYVQAWSLAHFFLFAEDGKYKLGFLNFLVNLNRGADWRRSFLAAFGAPDFQAIEAKWLKHVQETPPSDYRTTVRRLDFLAAGMAKLREQEIYPETLDELRGRLEQIGFSHSSDLFGESQQLAARQPETFTVPFAEAASGREFVLVDISPGAGRRSSRQQPPPKNVVVQGLKPETFAVTWQPRGRQWQYSVISGPAAERVVRAAAARTARTRTPTDPTEQADTAEPVEPPRDRPNTPEPRPKFRKWNSADGNYSTLAVLIEYGDGRVRLKRADGREVKVPFERLSPADQQYVEQWQARQ